MTRLFITSTGTGIGKTLVTCALSHQLREAGVRAVKPVASGFDAGDAGSDTALLLQAQGLSDAAEISPWRFAAPLAPNMAAKREGRELALGELVAYCNEQKARHVLVEGVGGVMAPLTDRETVLDWMRALDWPVLLVVGNYLGSISHTLTSLRAMKGLRVRGVVVSESADAAVSPQELLATLAHHLPAGCKTGVIPRLANGAQNWQNAPDLTHLVKEDAG